MDFRGHLRLPEDAGIGIPVELRLDDIFVIITSDGDELGAWRADDVVIERIFSNQFAVELDGESMVFIAQDALGFAYDGIGAIENLQERLTKRRVFKRSKKKKVEAPETVEEPPEPSTVSTPVEPAVVDDEVPEFRGQPEPIWSPPSSTPATTPPSPVPAPAEPSVPEPIRERVEAQPSEPRPAEVRVSYPQPIEVPAPIAAEDFVPPSPADHVAAPTPARVDPVEPEPVAVPQPEQAGSAVVPAAPAEPELEIEEVAAAASGATWMDDRVHPVTEEVEIEIDEYVLPAAGVADTYTAHLPDPAGSSAAGSERSEVAEIDDAGGGGEVATPPVEAPATPEELVGADVGGTAEDEPDVGADADVLATAAVQSNGKGKVRHLATDHDESERKIRRHSLFGRSRDKKVPSHEHRYGDPKTIGGLTRAVCEICGRVTFTGEDAYQGW